MKTKHLLLLVTPLLLATCKENEPEEIQPTALFSFAQKELTVSFTNVSQNAQTYTWDFGDGTTSTDANPVHTYSKSGTWQVVLIAKNIIKTDSCIQNITISQAEITPTPNFSYTTSGLSVTFKNTSINATSYNWDFGDGQTSTANNPLHTYKSHGVFRVTLTASNGSKSNYVSQSITLKEQTPQASFTYTTTHPLKVILKNTSTNAISYEWDFGDGSTSTEKNPTHRYNGIGVYKVKLIAKNGSLSNVYSTNVEIKAPTTCFITGFTITKIPTNNKYYQVQLTDDYVLSKTTYFWTAWYILSAANLPFEKTLNSPQKININNEYVIRLYKYSGTGNPTNSQASGKGFWSASILPSYLQTYPETTIYSNTSASITLKFRWE